MFHANRLDERELASLLRKGDTAAQRAFYDRYAGYLAGVCSRYIPDKDRMKDVLQEAFIRIYSKMGSFEYRGEGSLKAWARRIVVNMALNSLRATNEQRIIHDLPDMALEDEPPEPRAISQRVMQEMIKALPDGYRTVFNLYVFEELTHSEIARLLGIKESTSASQYFRAKAMLARNIRDYQKNHGDE